MDNARRVYIEKHPTKNGYVLVPHWTEESGGKPVLASAIDTECYSSLEAAKEAALAKFGATESDIYVSSKEAIPLERAADRGNSASGGD